MAPRHYTSATGHDLRDPQGAAHLAGGTQASEDRSWSVRTARIRLAPLAPRLPQGVHLAPLARSVRTVDVLRAGGARLAAGATVRRKRLLLIGCVALAGCGNGAVFPAARGLKGSSRSGTQRSAALCARTTDGSGSARCGRRVDNQPASQCSRVVRTPPKSLTSGAAPTCSPSPSLDESSPSHIRRRSDIANRFVRFVAYTQLCASSHKNSPQACIILVDPKHSSIPPPLEAARITCGPLPV
jgi:hypothetical protein